MRVLITGGSGFIGSSLASRLRALGHATRVLDRMPPKDGGDAVVCDLQQPLPNGVLDDVDAVAHLAGVPIDIPWTPGNKVLIRESRVVTAQRLVEAIGKAERRPRVLVSASASGYYGDRGETVLAEDAGHGDDFLASVCVDWEAAARQAESFGLRTVQVRTALVLGQGGLLRRLAPIFRLGLGGPLGNGRQWFPWLHVDDVIGIYVHALTNEKMSGPYNTAAPGIVRNKEFARALGKALRRPAVLPVPRFALRLALGEFADSIVASQRIDSARLRESGFVHKYPTLQEALTQIYA